MTTHTRPKPAGTPTWVDLQTPDIDAARTFYHAVLGWEYDIGGAEYGGYTNATAGGRTAAGMAGPMPGAPPQPAAWSLYFATDDIALMQFAFRFLRQVMFGEESISLNAEAAQERLAKVQEKRLVEEREAAKRRALEAEEGYADDGE